MHWVWRDVVSFGVVIVVGFYITEGKKLYTHGKTLSSGFSFFSNIILLSLVGFYPKYKRTLSIRLKYVLTETCANGTVMSLRLKISAPFKKWYHELHVIVRLKFGQCGVITISCSYTHVTLSGNDSS